MIRPLLPSAAKLIRAPSRLAETGAPGPAWFCGDAAMVGGIMTTDGTLAGP